MSEEPRKDATPAQLEERAKQGEAQAQFELGAAYRDGSGVVQDLRRAVYWYERAANQQHVEALFRLAMLKGAGEGCQADHSEAERLLRLAAKHGHEAAEIVLQELGRLDSAAQARKRELGLQ